MTALTKNQIDAMRSLSRFVGETVNVLTSEYTYNIDKAFVFSCRGTFKSAALRGLEKRGFIRIECAFWKGAKITVLRANND